MLSSSTKSPTSSRRWMIMWMAPSLALEDVWRNKPVPRHPAVLTTVNDDAELLARIRNGTADDFGELIRRHQSQIFAILHSYERDFQKVEDLAQETFLKAWRFLDRFDGRAPLSHWLAKI